MAPAPQRDDTWRIARDPLVLCVRLTPKSPRDILDGIELLADGRKVLKARVRAVPEADKANAALPRLVAEALDVAPAAVRLEGGGRSRVKVLRIAGDGKMLARRLAGWAAIRAP